MKELKLPPLITVRERIIAEREKRQLATYFYHEHIEKSDQYRVS